MTTTTTPLFETEMRNQVAAAEAGIIDATVMGDPVLLDAARAHLDGLIDLARRNGLDITPLVAAEPDEIVVLPEPSEEPSSVNV
jgi:hypothetical protein